MSCFPELLDKISNPHSRQQTADLKLQFDLSSNGKSFISDQYCRHPYHLCRAQYPDLCPSGLATIYIQSCAGGIFESDKLLCDIHALPHSQAHVTTQASTIVHRMENGGAQQSVVIQADNDSLLEYLPDPLILFPESRMHSNIVVRMHPTATVCIADAFILHDPGNCGDNLSELYSEMRVEDLNGNLLCLDRYHTSSAQVLSDQIGVMGMFNVQGTLMFLCRKEYKQVLYEAIKELVTLSNTTYAGVSILPNDCGIWVRIITTEAYELRSLMDKLWMCGRFVLTGASPQVRRK